MPDIESNRKDFDIAAWNVEPGDVDFFDFNATHGEAPTGNRRRRAHRLRVFGEDVVLRNFGIDRLGFPYIAATHRDGVSLHHVAVPEGATPGSATSVT
jgi:hypothetical protein